MTDDIQAKYDELVDTETILVCFNHSSNEITINIYMPDLVERGLGILSIGGAMQRYGMDRVSVFIWGDMWNGKLIPLAERDEIEWHLKDYVAGKISILKMQEILIDAGNWWAEVAFI